MQITRAERRRLEGRGYDLPLIMSTQPQGGITFGDRYVTTGDGYICILHLYRVADTVPLFWLTHLMNNSNTLTALDITTANKEKVIDTMDRDIGELRDRAENARSTSERDDAATEMTNLRRAALDINQGGEIYKQVRCRIVMYDASLDELEKRIGALRRELGGKKHKLTVDLFRTKGEWLSMFYSYDQQSQIYRTRQGVLMPSKSIGGGIPFHHDALKDPRGGFIGQTSTNGAVMFDPFYSTDTRTNFNGIIFGKPGSGKSTLLKLLIEILAARGCMIRGFDKARDYYDLVLGMGGKIIDLSGGRGLVNPLHVYATLTVEQTGMVDEYGSFMQHLAKVSNQLRFMEPGITEIEIIDFKQILSEFYIASGLLPKNYSQNKQSIRITGRAANQYPTLSEFNQFIQKYELKKATPERVRTLEKLTIVVNNMATQYGPLFNGHTTIENLENEQIVFFDIDGISQMDRSVFQCQLFTALTMIWSHAIKQGRKMKRLLDAGKIRMEDVIYFETIIDECQNFINHNNIFAVEYLNTFQREMRKFVAGIWYATQSPQEVLPESASDQSVAAIKKIFELTQYKVFYNLDPSVLGRMREALGHTLTDTQYQQLADMKRGEALFQVSSNKTILLKTSLEKEQEARFKGGL